jgi:uncharacterized membrane protein YfcA
MLWFLIASFVIVLVASAAQAVTGFGFALLAVPLLATVADAPTAVVGTSVVGLVPTLVTAVRDQGSVAWRAVWLLLTAAVFGMPVGLVILRTAPESVLIVLIAAVVVGCTLIVWRPPPLPRFEISNHRVALGAVGVLTGVLTTSTGTNGPPLVAAFTALGFAPRALRATLAAVFLGTGVIGAAGFVIAGAVTERASLVALVGLPAAVLGWLAGDRLFARLNGETFRRVLLAALVACCLVSVGRVVVG